MSIETMTKIASTVVGAGGSGTITFSNIPQSYTDLKILISSRDTSLNGNNNFANISMFFNGDASTNYTYIHTYGLGSLTGSSSSTASGIGTLYGSSAFATANTFGYCEIYISDYTSNRFKMISSDSGSATNATGALIGMAMHQWKSANPITSISFSPMTLFAQHTSISIYGIKNSSKTVGNSIKATGGAVSFDGTYVMHTFYGSGTFIPSQNLNVDYLVVAGGGSGGNSVGYLECSGGGGAGGYRTSAGTSGRNSSPEQSLYLSGSTPYSVLVGAGGPVKTTYGGGSNGTDSSFYNIISKGGGAGGADGSGNSGGSGGGAGTSGGIDRTPGSGTANQGYDGGFSKAVSSGSINNAGGGGGGAGSIGINGLSGIAGAGGSGLKAFNERFYSGGGGGNTYGSGGTQGSGGIGGGGAGVSTSTNSNGFSGSVNSGGGGGASGFSGSSSGAGGSGIVIIRYKA